MLRIQHAFHALKARRYTQYWPFSKMAHVAVAMLALAGCAEAPLGSLRSTTSAEVQSSETSWRAARRAREDQLIAMAAAGRADLPAAIRAAAIANVDAEPPPLPAETTGSRVRSLPSLGSRDAAVAAEEARLTQILASRSGEVQQARAAARPQQSAALVR